MKSRLERASAAPEMNPMFGYQRKNLPGFERFNVPESRLELPTFGL
jgi:hypothetical protein